MVGILYAYEENGQLHLTSRHDGDAGIYLAIGKNVMRLPLQEHFQIAAVDDKTLTARHQMTLWGIPFYKLIIILKEMCRLAGNPSSEREGPI